MNTTHRQRRDAGQWDFEFYRGDPSSWPDTLKERWDRLSTDDCCASPFQMRPVVETWYRHKGRALGMQPIVCMARESGSGQEVLLPLAVLPRQSRTLWTRRVIAAGEPHFDYQDPLVSPGGGPDPGNGGFWLPLVRALADECEAHQLFINRLVRSGRPAGAVEDTQLRAPFAPLLGAASLDEYLSRRSPNLRTDVRRRIRRLSERGAVSATFLEPHDVENAVTELGRMVAAYEELWEGQPSAILFQTPGTRAWYHDLMRTCLPTGLVQFAVLRVDSESVAWCIGFVRRGILSWYKPTYRKEWATLSPGKVLLANVIEHACRIGWKEIDFGPGTEEYKLRWTTDARPVFAWHWQRTVPRQAAVNLMRRLRR